MKISEKYLDMAKKWRVRVTFDDGSSAFFKFQTEPTEEQVFVEANKYLNLKPVVNEEQQKQDLIREVSLSELKTKLGVISGITK